MKLFDILTEYRRQIQDRVKPYLVANEEAIAYLNEAHREAARRARLIVDSTTDNVAKVSVQSGIPLVEISSKIVAIRRIRLESRSAPLRKRLVRDMDELAPGWDASTNLSQPSTVVVDYQSDALYLYPPPKNDDVLLMTIVREPLEDLKDDDDEPEIPGRYHHTLIEWMKFKTYSNEDTDLYDTKKANGALSNFEGEFGGRIGALDERFEFEHYDDVGER